MNKTVKHILFAISTLTITNAAEADAATVERGAAFGWDRQYFYAIDEHDRKKIEDHVSVARARLLRKFEAVNEVFGEDSTHQNLLKIIFERDVRAYLQKMVQFWAFFERELLKQLESERAQSTDATDSKEEDADRSEISKVDLRLVMRFLKRRIASPGRRAPASCHGHTKEESAYFHSSLETAALKTKDEESALKKGFKAELPEQASWWDTLTNPFGGYSAQVHYTHSLARIAEEDVKCEHVNDKTREVLLFMKALQDIEGVAHAYNKGRLEEFIKAKEEGPKK